AGGKLSAATMRRVEEFVAERLEGALRLDELADVACVSKFHFSRLFKRTTGLTPHRYVIRCRVRRAQLLLRDPTYNDYSIAGVAVRCGFVDQSHLGRHFKAQLGVTPAEYRRG
ncbi:MAG: AraC family transcriptional regulator, partial [Planctomycetota bacterium]